MEDPVLKKNNLKDLQQYTHTIYVYNIVIRKKRFLLSIISMFIIVQFKLYCCWHSGRLYNLQDRMRPIMASEIEVVVHEERFSTF